MFSVFSSLFFKWQTSCKLFFDLDPWSVFCSVSSLLLAVAVASKPFLWKGRSPTAAASGRSRDALRLPASRPLPGFDMQPADADLKIDGTFRVELVPGKYNLNLECWDVEPSMENPSAAKSFIPDTHLAGIKSGFKVDVQPDAKVVKFDADVPKPQ